VDLTFFEGIGAVAAAILVFCGSIWLLITMVAGARLAYFIVASVVLAFLLIMSIVWSLNPLGPVGELPSWSSIAVAPSVAKINFGPASSYPSAPWHTVNTKDVAEATKASSLQAESTDALATAIEKGQVPFESTTEATANLDTVRLLPQGDQEYGAVTYEAAAGAGAPKGAKAVVVMKYHPGNPLGPPKVIAAGAAVLLLVHLVGLSFSERKVRREREEGV
jgi:hypothetical protein